MRNLRKTESPDVLSENGANWLEEYKLDRASNVKRYRYRHPDIKSALKEETGSKCVYCESKIGHNTPGDVEHKVPSSVDVDRHFSWDNLTIACTECNRRKNAYFDVNRPFLDPYVDDVEGRLMHHGPLVCWVAGDASAETSVKILQIHDGSRAELLMRKIEKIDELNNLVERLTTANEALREIIWAKIRQMTKVDAEYSAMVAAICGRHGIA